MPGGRRDQLKFVGDSAPATAHWGLWLDRFLSGDKETSESHGPHIRAITERVAPNGYADRFKTWRQGFLESGAECLVLEAEVQGRMIVGLGSKGTLEAGIRLDHTWGVPVIPGSSLKGVAAAGAHLLRGESDAHWSKPESPDAGARPDSDFDILFGSTDEAGAVRFHDAWWIPGSGENKPLRIDVMTVHHAKYYQAAEGSEVPPPSDMDSPNPVAFVSAVGRYLIVLEGANDAWRRAAADFLSLAFKHLGVGAKTNAGYGRLKLEENGAPYVLRAERAAAEEARRLKEVEARVRQRAALETRFARLDKGNFNIGVVGPLLADLDTQYPEVEDETRRSLLSALVTRLTPTWLQSRTGDAQALAERVLVGAGVSPVEAAPTPAPAQTPTEPVDPLIERVNTESNKPNWQDALRRLTVSAETEAWGKPHVRHLLKVVESRLPNPADRKPPQKDWVKGLKALLKSAPD
jgi:CRISPR-associated protein Cmr6